MLTAVSAELPLLVFSILVPCGLAALGLIGCLRGFCDAQSDVKKADSLLLIPGILVLIGLVASVFHLGAPGNMFGMFAGIGTSPLSNEIACAGISIVVAAVYVIAALAKHPGTGFHKAFGVATLALGLLTAVMTGLAYSIRTIPTWNNAFGWIGQLGLALVAGAALAALVVALDGSLGKKSGTTLGIVAAAGAVLAVVALFAQGGAAGAVVSSAGTTLSGIMGDYNLFAGIACALAVATVACILVGARGKSNAKALAGVAVACVLVCAVLMRADFYGIYLTVGLA